MQTIGERLEEARKRKGISIREAAEATKIRGDYLQKFETNQFDLDLADIYVRGFLRTYANFLKLPAEKIVNDFNGLGVAKTNRGRTPSREVYGRMDLSVASTEEAAEAPAPAPEAASNEPAAPRRNPSSFTRGGGTGMPAGPKIDPNLVLKGGLALAGLIVLVLIIWGVRALVSDSGPTPAPKTAGQSPPTVTPATRNRIRFTALDNVRVTVATYNWTTQAIGEQLFQRELKRNETAEIPWTEALLITANVGENLRLEVNGAIVDHKITGYNSARLQAPPR